MNVSHEDVVALWKKHLQVDVVNDQDNFFDLGGDSVRVLRIAYELSLRYSAWMDVRGFYANPTPAGLLQATVG